MWCYNTQTGRREPDNRCLYIPYKPPKIMTCNKPCRNPTYEVMWGISPWSDCALEPGVTVCSRARGIQTRDVSCYYRGDEKRQPEATCLQYEPKPETIRNCEFQCPQDCIVGSFTKWNNCEDCRIRNRTRTREIVVAPENGGKPCPGFSEHIPCGNCTDANFLKFYNWTKCRSFRDKSNPLQPTHPLIGAQGRRIDCLDMRGNTADLT